MAISDMDGRWQRWQAQCAVVTLQAVKLSFLHQPGSPNLRTSLERSSTSVCSFTEVSKVDVVPPQEHCASPCVESASAPCDGPWKDIPDDILKRVSACVLHLDTCFERLQSTLNCMDCRVLNVQCESNPLCFQFLQNIAEFICCCMKFGDIPVLRAEEVASNVLFVPMLMTFRAVHIQSLHAEGRALWTFQQSNLRGA
jgi:hypothetical protein